ncbi:type II toxin-antitoxin system VapC family toxin [bacterium]|nr:type II toxin-antitoxin system VapC family toxin [bacterium]
MKEATFDTNIITAYFKEHPKVIQKIGAYQKQFGRIKLNILSYYELLRGYKDLASTKKLQSFREFASKCEILDIDLTVMEKASDIYVQLKKTGRLIEDADILIAAIAMVNNLMLVTDNIRHFNRIDGLQIENWM